METLRATYIGEAFTAAGFALAGVEPRVTAADAAAVWRALTEARRAADLVILDQAHAGLVETRLRDLIAAEPIPPVVVVPGMDRDAAPRDRVVAAARRALGLG